jgi:hypothetical protein
LIQSISYYWENLKSQAQGSSLSAQVKFQDQDMV